MTPGGGMVLADRRSPKPILAQVGLEGRAELTVRGGVIEIRPACGDARKGWAEDAARIAAVGDDRLIWPEIGNADDAELVW